MKSAGLGELPRGASRDGGPPRPVFAVWELTLRCDQRCGHCGSRAGPPRPNELSTDEVLDVARALARLGCRECTLIGGEAYLRADLPLVVAELARLGVRVGLQTGGRAFDTERALALRDAGLDTVGVSVDGPEAVHDVLRGWRGSYSAAMRAIEASVAAGLVTTSNLQVNRLNVDHLRAVFDALRDRRVAAWQVQLTVAMGNAADRPEWILEPAQVIDVIDALAGLQAEAAARPRPWESDRFYIWAGNNLGYFGPHEATLRSVPGLGVSHYSGCKAGIHVVGIEADGTVKGCPSLPTGPYAGGNVREASLDDLWANADALRFARERTTEELWGFCRTCAYADVCRGGCSFTAHATLGKRGNNPFCYHRAATLRHQGLRERLVLRDKAPGLPFDFGRFDLVEEPREPPSGGSAAG